MLVYRSEPFAQDTEITGPVALTLPTGSHATDADFTATLVDVYPSRLMIHLCEGIIRARFQSWVPNNQR